MDFSVFYGLFRFTGLSMLWISLFSMGCFGFQACLFYGFLCFLWIVSISRLVYDMDFSVFYGFFSVSRLVYSMDFSVFYGLFRFPGLSIQWISLFSMDFFGFQACLFYGFLCFLWIVPVSRLVYPMDFSVFDVLFWFPGLFFLWISLFYTDCSSFQACLFYRFYGFICFLLIVLVSSLVYSMDFSVFYGFFWFPCLSILWMSRFSTGCFHAI